MFTFVNLTVRVNGHANNIYAAFAHLQKGSIKVPVNQSVKKGDILEKIGHSGNSTAPHLHFQLMDSSDILSTKGIPCAFERYDLFQEGEWKTVYKGAIIIISFGISKWIVSSCSFKTVGLLCSRTGLSLIVPKTASAFASPTLDTGYRTSRTTSNMTLSVNKISDFGEYEI